MLRGNYAETEPDHHSQDQDEDPAHRLTIAHSGILLAERQRSPPRMHGGVVGSIGDMLWK
jgi:hypothetical protein